MGLFQPSFDVEPFTFRGQNLTEIAFPLGGIGTGCVSLDGRGSLRDWEIFNRPNKNCLLEKTFPALWIHTEGEEPRALSLQGPRLREWFGEGHGPWTVGHGNFFRQMDGLPGFDEVEFSGTFPVARVRFRKKELPLEVELCAFSPFIPLDNRSSSFPGACLVYRLKNVSNKPVDATLVWSMMNPVGEGAPAGEDQCRTEFLDNGLTRGLQFHNDRFGDELVQQGTAALTTTWPNVTYLAQWQTSGWFDSVQTFWNTLKATGRLETDLAEPTSRRNPGSLGAIVTLKPGEEVEVPFLISWRFPLTTKYWAGSDEPPRKPWKPFYASQWTSAWDVATEFFDRFEELSGRTQAFEEALFTSTLPCDVIQSISATASILHTPTVLQLEDGTYWAWEGCGPTEGCCDGTCSHVWNYALTHAFLFPEVQRSMRSTDYRHSFTCGPLGKEGAMNFRVMIPLGVERELWHAASDGQLGGVVQLFRDWKLWGDDEYLKELWPSAKRALEFAWHQWDRDQDGLVDGDQHNTYDINFQGPNPLTQFFYLAALRAGEEISRHLGDRAAADRYRTIYESGRKLTEERLWNGEFFVQENPYTELDAPKYQHGKGCLSDQLFGQLSATVAGLGDLVEPELIRKALESVYRHNFLNPLGDHENLQRVYAVADEPGLILCSWPNGGRPYYPFVYSDEVWTGIEYQVASHLAFAGMRDEAVSIAAGIRKRYDGRRRNPWNEFECGSHYARAMASYGLLLALSGFRYDACDRVAELAQDGRFFFSTPHGWGVAVRENGKTRFEVVEGSLFPN